MGTAPGGAEGGDGLAAQLVGLQEGMDDLGSPAPPDRIADEYRVILLHVFHGAGDGGSGVRVVLFGVGPAVGVVIQVGSGVGLGGYDLKEIAACRLRCRFRHRAGVSGGREVRHQHLSPTGVPFVGGSAGKAGGLI